MYDEGPLYALDKCFEGQTTLEEAKHLTSSKMQNKVTLLTPQCTALFRERPSSLVRFLFDRVEGHGGLSESWIRYCEGTSIYLGLAAGPDKIMAEQLLTNLKSILFGKTCSLNGFSLPI